MPMTAICCLRGCLGARERRHLELRRRRWPDEKACLQTELRAGDYRFDNLSRVTRRADALWRLADQGTTGAA